MSGESHLIALKKKSFCSHIVLNFKIFSTTSSTNAYINDKSFIVNIIYFYAQEL